MENLIIAFNCVIPVFLIICTGTLIRRSEKFPEELFPQLSNMSFLFLLPCMLFHGVYTTDLSVSFDPELILFQAVFLLIWYLIGFVLATRFIPDHRARGAIIQTIYRSNIAIVGLSMAGSMMGDSGVATMSMSIAVLVPIYNILAVITLEVCRGGKVQLRPTLVGIAKNPLLISCLLGIVFLLLGIHIPAPILKAINQIGNAGSVVTLLTLGASFQLSGVFKNWKKLVFANLLRLVITPFVTLAVAFLLGFRGNALGVILLCNSPSLATTAYPMAMARDSDHELTGQIVVTTSFFCCITMFLWIFTLKQLGLV